MIARLVAALAFALVLTSARGALADRCDSDGVAWIARCAKSSGLAMTLQGCPVGVAIVEVAATPPLRVELSIDRPAFQKVGRYGFSPVGSFEDWSAEPVSTRAAFDAVVACAKAEPPDALLIGETAAPRVDEPAHPRRRQLPFLLIAAALVSITAAIASARRARHIANTLQFLAATLAIVVVRSMLARFAFFHQNGQGPFWILQAVVGDAGEYGPGYPELFHRLTESARRPDQIIAYAQLFLGAVVVALTFVMARVLGGGRLLAAAVAVAVLLDPVLIRTSRSESYFATILALLMMAAAALMIGDANSRPHRHRPFLVGAVVAALLIAQAARVHPMSWVAAATVPLVLLVRGEDLRLRLRRVVLAAAVIAIGAAPFVLPAMLRTIRGGLGVGFMGGARTRVALLAVRALVVVGGVALLLLPRRTRTVGAALLAAARAIAAAFVTNVVAHDAPVVSAAYLHLFAPAVLAAIAAIAMRFERAHVVVAVFAALAAVHVGRERALLELPTDAREQDWWLALRETLPANAEVATVERAGTRTMFLPLVGQRLPRAVRIDESGNAPYQAGARFYYRSSVCETPEGAPICARFEATHHLRELQRRTLPSQGSLPWLPLHAGSMDVVLFAVD